MIDLEQIKQIEEIFGKKLKKCETLHPYSNSYILKNGKVKGLSIDKALINKISLLKQFKNLTYLNPFFYKVDWF